MVKKIDIGRNYFSVDLSLYKRDTSVDLLEFNSSKGELISYFKQTK